MADSLKLLHRKELKKRRKDSIRMVCAITDFLNHITAKGSTDTAVEVMRLGVFDYLIKPFRPEEISLVIMRALGQRKLYNEILYLRQQLAERY